uniref:Uncharacterized protein n=1 Tax=CrAss-like virus sp. ctyM420 TaxID=2828014 RepID=A0A8S5TJN7_9CAUD|nr:MAG TPA: hypothetical protein [CrAss-like virus sp. ctyM420]
MLAHNGGRQAVVLLKAWFQMLMAIRKALHT